MTNPDTPLNLMEYYPARTARSLGLQFDPGYSNGGADILDYRITYTTDFDGTTTVITGVL